MEKEKRQLNINLLLLAACCTAVIAGLVAGKFWLDTANELLGIITLAGVFGGSFGVKRYWQNAFQGETKIDIIKPVAKGPANCLCIYPDKVVFDNVASPEGQPYQCLNDNKHYYINIWDEAIKRLVPFVLPDLQYYTPQLFAERVLELPAHRRIFRRRENLLQKLSPFILLVVIGVLWLLIMTTTTPGG
jgi:hypothetical protein